MPHASCFARPPLPPPFPRCCSSLLPVPPLPPAFRRFRSALKRGMNSRRLFDGSPCCCLYRSTQAVMSMSGSRNLRGMRSRRSCSSCSYSISLFRIFPASYSGFHLFWNSPGEVHSYLDRRGVGGMAVKIEFRASEASEQPR